MRVTALGSWVKLRERSIGRGVSCGGMGSAAQIESISAHDE